MGCSPRGLKELDTTERLAQHGVTRQRGQDTCQISLLPNHTLWPLPKAPDCLPDK